MFEPITQQAPSVVDAPMFPVEKVAPLPYEHSIETLIRHAKSTTIPWIIEGLWQEGGIVVVHSLEEEFKSVCAFQLAEAVASGQPFLGLWRVPRPRRTGIFETEMDDLEMGRRLAGMYPHGNFPRKLAVSQESLLRKFRACTTLAAKTGCVETWMNSQGLDLLVWDTINSILATADPNSEVAVSRFFDAIGQLPHRGILLVRHDVKPSRDSQLRGSNQLVRGSNRLVEDASLVIHLRRQDKASHKVRFEVGKLRNGPKAEPIELWFDAGTFRLTALPPVAALLESGPLTREELIEQAHSRFGLKTRALDNHIQELRPYLQESSDGHRRVWGLNPKAVPDPESSVDRWWQILKSAGMPSERMQGCISTLSTPPERLEPARQPPDTPVGPVWGGERERLRQLGLAQ